MKYRLLSLFIPLIFYSVDLFAKGKSDQEQQTAEKHTEELNADNSNAHDEAHHQTTSKNPDVEGNADQSKGESSGSQIHKGAEEAEETIKLGNLAFPPSQQPSPMVSFGQNIINRKQMQAQLSAINFKGEDQYSININPALIYAFTDSFSIFLVAPCVIRTEQEDHHSSGPADAIIQLEYAFYTKSHYTYYDQATIVANVTLPTGSAKKDPPTGVGSNSFFVGGTFSRMEIDWFWFVSPGAILNGSSHRTKFGNQYLYQCGFGRRITNTDEWLFDWMVEFDGTYSEKNKIRGKQDRNSGGNIIYLTPSLWISSKDSLNFQIGVGFPIFQHFFGHQKKFDYLIMSTTDWLF